MKNITSSLFFLLIFVVEISAQNIFASTAYNEIVTLDENDVLSELIVEVTSDFAILDIAISPNNKYYGIIADEIVEINLNDGSVNSVINLPVFNPAQDNYTSLVCSNNYELYTLNNLSKILYRYDILSDTLINVAALSISTPGDMTLYKGNLIIPTGEDLKAFNIESNSFKTIFCYPPEIYSLLGIANDFISCDENRIVATDSERYWEIDLETGSINLFMTTTEYITYGLASNNEYSASNCNVELEDIDCTISSIQKLETKPINISIAPNPVKGTLTITTNFQLDKIDIYNVNGKLKHTILNPSKEIDITLLEKGFYYLLCYSENESASLKFVKQ